MNVLDLIAKPTAPAPAPTPSRAPSNPDKTKPAFADALADAGEEDDVPPAEPVVGTSGENGLSGELLALIEQQAIANPSTTSTPADAADAAQPAGTLDAAFAAGLGPAASALVQTNAPLADATTTDSRSEGVASASRQQGRVVMANKSQGNAAENTFTLASSAEPSPASDGDTAESTVDAQPSTAQAARRTSSGAPSSAPVPEAAAILAAKPDVVSIQGTVVKEKQTPQTAPSVAEADPVASDRAKAVPASDVSDVKASSDAQPAEEDVVTAKPEAADKAASADKSADPRAIPPHGLGTDKSVPADAVAKAHQPTQNLPAAAIEHVASQIAGHAKRGATKFEIRLDPPELGRVDVRIQVDKDGTVTTRLTVEKSETLDLLKADQRALERALHEAGFKSDQNSLSFSLKDDRAGGQAKFEDLRDLREQAAAHIDTGEEPARLAAGTAYRASPRGPGGFDLSV